MVSLRARNWNEAKHPRDDRGRFARKGGARWASKVLKGFEARFGDTSMAQGQDPRERGRLQTGAGGLLDIAGMGKAARERFPKAPTVAKGTFERGPSSASSSNAGVTGPTTKRAFAIKIGDRFMHNGAEVEAVGVPRAGRKAGQAVTVVKVRRISDDKIGPITIPGESVRMAGPSERQDFVEVPLGRSPGDEPFRGVAGGAAARMEALRERAGLGRTPGGVDMSRVPVKAGGVTTPPTTSLDKANAARKAYRTADLEASNDPKDNNAKIKAIQDGTLDYADLYRTHEAGPSGQRGRIKAGRVRHTPDNPSGEFRVVDGDGRLAGWVSRVNRDGEIKYSTTREDYDGGTELLGWADSLAHAADVLTHGEAQASSGGSLDARRISGRLFERNPARGKTLDELDQEAAQREVARAREALKNPNLGPSIRAAHERTIANGGIPATWRTALAKIDASEVGKDRGLHPGEISPEVRRRLLAAGLMEGREASSALGRREYLHLTPAGHEALKAAEGDKYEQRRATVAAKAAKVAATEAAQREKAAAAQVKRDEKLARDLEVARAEGLDEQVVRIGGLDHARRERDRKAAEAQAAEQAAIALGVPEYLKGQGGYSGPNYQAALDTNAKLIKKLRKDHTDEEIKTIAPQYRAYADAMTALDKARADVASAQRRSEYINTTRLTTEDERYRASLDASNVDVRAAFAAEQDAYRAATQAHNALERAAVGLYTNKGRAKKASVLGIPAPERTRPVDSSPTLQQRVREGLPNTEGAANAQVKAARQAILNRLRTEDQIANEEAIAKRHESRAGQIMRYEGGDSPHATPERTAKREEAAKQRELAGQAKGRARALEAQLNVRREEERKALMRMEASKPQVVAGASYAEVVAAVDAASVGGRSYRNDEKGWRADIRARLNLPDIGDEPMMGNERIEVSRDDIRVGDFIGDGRGGNGFQVASVTRNNDGSILLAGIGMLGVGTRTLKADESDTLKVWRPGVSDQNRAPLRPEEDDLPLMARRMLQGLDEDERYAAAERLRASKGLPSRPRAGGAGTFNSSQVVAGAKTAPLGTVLATGERAASGHKYRMVAAEHRSGLRYVAQQTFDTISNTWDETGRHFNTEDLDATLKTQAGVGVTWSSGGGAGADFLAETKAALADSDPRRDGSWNLSEKPPPGAKIPLTRNGTIKAPRSGRTPGGRALRQDPDEVAGKLRAINTRQEANEALKDLTLAELKAVHDAWLASQPETPFNRGKLAAKTKAEAVEKLVELTVGARINSEAIRRGVRRGAEGRAPGGKA